MSDAHGVARDQLRSFIERIEQPKDRLVLDSFEPLSRLWRLARGRQILKELSWLAGHTSRPQRFDEQRAAAALRRKDQVCRGMA